MRGRTGKVLASVCVLVALAWLELVTRSKPLALDPSGACESLNVAAGLGRSGIHSGRRLLLAIPGDALQVYNSAVDEKR